MSEKKVFKGISFYVGLKLEKNGCLYACLYCENDYEFSLVNFSNFVFFKLNLKNLEELT